jgi:hypothetical protein
MNQQRGDDFITTFVGGVIALIFVFFLMGGCTLLVFGDGESSLSEHSLEK